MNVPPGKYEVLLELNDPLFPDNPDYNILLLNKGIAEISTGLNNLDHTIVVKHCGDYRRTQIKLFLIFYNVAWFDFVQFVA